tara:strand:+ start:5235 stop:5507 length:273 start_codon:yes stop_codon:yes gene_type:complete
MRTIKVTKDQESTILDLILMKHETLESELRDSISHNEDDLYLLSEQGKDWNIQYKELQEVARAYSAFKPGYVLSNDIEEEFDKLNKKGDK